MPTKLAGIKVSADSVLLVTMTRDAAGDFTLLDQSTVKLQAGARPEAYQILQGQLADYRHATCHDWAQALAGLPVTPDWHCQFATDAIDWSASIGARILQVALRIHSPRKHEWWAERTGGSKRTMLVGGGHGRIISSRQAERELTDFFAQALR